MAKKSDTEEAITAILSILIGIIVLIMNIFIFVIDFVILIINIFKKNKIKFIHFISFNPSENINYSESKNSKTDVELENKMDAYELEDWQKKLVRKGDYDPENFEEDGTLEEDDYYYEDDK